MYLKVLHKTGDGGILVVASWLRGEVPTWDRLSLLLTI